MATNNNSFRIQTTTANIPGPLKELIIAGALLVISVTTFASILTTPDTLIYNEDVDFVYGYETTMGRDYSLDGFSLWTPYYGGGSPSLGKIQAGLLYLPQALLRITLPIVDRLNWGVVVHVFIAGYGIYWLMRDLKASPTAATFSAIAFMLSGSIIPRALAGHISVLYAVAWAGWLLFAYRRMLYQPTWWNLCLTILFSSFVILGGHAQISITVFLVPISYFLFVFVIECLRDRRWRFLFRGFVLSVLMAILTLGLTAAQMIPFLEWIQFTTRGVGSAFFSIEFMLRNSVQLQHLLTPILPLLWFDSESSTSIYLGLPSNLREISSFVGLISLCLIVLGLFRVKNQNKHLVIYFLGLAFFGLIMSMGTTNPMYPTILEILPYFRAPGRFMLLWTFSLAVLAGYFLDGLLLVFSDTNNRSTLKYPALFMTVCLLATAAFILWWDGSGMNILVQLDVQEKLVNIDLASLHAVFRRSALVLVLTLALIASLFWSKQLKFVTAKYWGFLAVGVLIVEMSLFAWLVLRPYPVSNLVDPANPLARLSIEPDQVRMNGYRQPPNYLVPTLDHTRNGEETVALVKLLEAGLRGQQLLSASYVAGNEPIVDPDWELINQENGAYLYRHVNTLPRIYAANSVDFVQSDDEALAYVLDDAFSPRERSVVTLSESGSHLVNQRFKLISAEPEPAQLFGEYLDFGNDVITARVRTDKPVMVVFGEMYYPGWQASIDGENSEIWQANYTFRGLIVNKGEHIIEMRYEPLSFRLGSFISLATFSIMVIPLIWLGIKRLRERKIDQENLGPLSENV